MEIIILCAGCLLGYTAGYHWKKINPQRNEYDILVFVGYPIISFIFIGLYLAF